MERQKVSSYWIRTALDRCTACFRWDLESDVDLVEEYARLFGMNILKKHYRFCIRCQHNMTLNIRWRELLEARLKEQHFLQAMNYHFVGREFQRQILGTQEQIKNCGLGTN